MQYLLQYIINISTALRKIEKLLFIFTRLFTHVIYLTCILKLHFLNLLKQLANVLSSEVWFIFQIIHNIKYRYILFHTEQSINHVVIYTNWSRTVYSSMLLKSTNFFFHSNKYMRTFFLWSLLLKNVLSVF